MDILYNSVYYVAKAWNSMAGIIIVNWKWIS